MSTTEVVQTIRDAIALRGKKVVAERAGLWHTILTGIDHNSWNPQLDTLRKLETAAVALLNEQKEARP